LAALTTLANGATPARRGDARSQKRRRLPVHARSWSAGGHAGFGKATRSVTWRTGSPRRCPHPLPPSSAGNDGIPFVTPRATQMTGLPLIAPHVSVGPSRHHHPLCPRRQVTRRDPTRPPRAAPARPRRRQLAPARAPPSAMPRPELPPVKASAGAASTRASYSESPRRPAGGAAGVIERGSCGAPRLSATGNVRGTVRLPEQVAGGLAMPGVRCRPLGSIESGGVSEGDFSSGKTRFGRFVLRGSRSIC
jgi:hypothetical protein